MPDVQTIRNIAADLGSKYGVESIYLFGSYAKGKASPDSDVDLLLEKGNIKGLIQLAALQHAFEASLGIPVDLLTPDCLDKEFLDCIEPEAILLYAGN